MANIVSTVTPSPKWSRARKDGCRDKNCDYSHRPRIIEAQRKKTRGQKKK